jgi:hypothetical protein
LPSMGMEGSCALNPSGRPGAESQAVQDVLEQPSRCHHGQGALLAGEQDFGMLALRDIRNGPDIPDGLAVRGLVGQGVAHHPDGPVVAAPHAVFGLEGQAARVGGVPGFLDPGQIGRVHGEAQALAYHLFLRQAQDAAQVIVDIGGDALQVVAEQAYRGNRGQGAVALLAVPQALHGLQLLGDVVGQRDGGALAGEIEVVVEHFRVEDRAVLAAVAADGFGFAFFDHLRYGGFQLGMLGLIPEILHGER